MRMVVFSPHFPLDKNPHCIIIEGINGRAAMLNIFSDLRLFADIVYFIREMNARVPGDINVTLELAMNDDKWVLVTSLPGMVEVIPLSDLTDTRWGEINEKVSHLWDRVLEDREVIHHPDPVPGSEDEWVIYHRHQLLIYEALRHYPVEEVSEEIMNHNYLSGEDTAAFLTRLKERTSV